MIEQTFQGRVINAASAGADKNSALIEAGNAVYGSFQVIWGSLTGTLDGTVKIQCSNDDGTTWDDISSASLTCSSANGHDTISLNGVLTEEKVRVAYAHNNCTGGTIDVYACLKG